MRTVIAIALACVVGLAAAPSNAGRIFAGYPTAILCSVGKPDDQGRRKLVAYYITAVERDGRVIYRPQAVQPVNVWIDGDLIVRAENLDDCDGLSVRQLTEEGRARD